MATNGECQDGQAPSVHESTTPTGLSPNVDDTTSANSPSVAHPDDSSVAHPKAKLINESWGSCSAGASVTEVFAEEINQNDLHLQVGVQSVQGARKTMEDEHQVINDGGGEKVSFFGVYDGHAGKKAAEFLRDQLHTTLLSHSQVQSEPESALKEAIEEAEVAFLARAKEVCCKFVPRESRFVHTPHWWVVTQTQVDVEASKASEILLPFSNR